MATRFPHRIRGNLDQKMDNFVHSQNTSVVFVGRERLRQFGTLRRLTVGMHKTIRNEDEDVHQCCLKIALWTTTCARKIQKSSITSQFVSMH